MIDNLKEHQELVRKIRNDQLTLELERANKETKKEGNIEGNIIPSVGDLVLIRSDAKDSSYDKYGVIQAILNPQTLRIRTRGGMIDRPTSITIPIVARCIIGDGSLRREKVQKEQDGESPQNGAE